MNKQSFILKQLGACFPILFMDATYKAAWKSHNDNENIARILGYKNSEKSSY